MICLVHHIYQAQEGQSINQQEQIYIFNSSGEKLHISDQSSNRQNFDNNEDPRTPFRPM